MAVQVRVPASSANLGPGFDSFAAALDLWLELEVSEADEFVLWSDLPLPADRTNLVVRAFERLHPADGLRFTLRSAIPISGGLGSSAAAIVAGLLAGSRFSGFDRDLLELATRVEGHPDNVAAALRGGVVICADAAAYRLDAPEDLRAVMVIPRDGVATRRARAALPVSVPLQDAAFNTAHGALLMVGLATGRAELVAHGLADRIHEPYRASLYPRSAELATRAAELGALGASISGAGPSVLFWVASERVPEVQARLEHESTGWADVLSVAFSDAGAMVLDR